MIRSRRSRWGDACTKDTSCGASAATIDPIHATPGPRAVADSLFLPATARQVFEAVFSASTLRIRVELPPPEKPRPRLVAFDVGDRQRRRKTWTQNVDRYALPEATNVRIEVAGSRTLRRILGEREQSGAAAGAQSG